MALSWLNCRLVQQGGTPVHHTTPERRAIMSENPPVNGTAKAGRIPPGNNSLANPYRPNFLAGCCEKGQNTTAPAYVLRP